MGEATDTGFLVVVPAAPSGAVAAPVRRRRILGGALVVTALIVAAVAAAGIVAARSLAESEAVADARSTTSLFATTLVEPALENAIADDATPAADRARTALARVVRTSILGTDGVVRVKLWTADGTIVYSDELRLVGRTYPLEADDLTALRDGGSDADVTDLHAPENRFERGNGKLLEAYRGVETPDGTKLLFEVYFRYDHVVERSGQLWSGFAGITLGSIAALLILLLPLVVWLLRRLGREEVVRRALLQRSLDASADERRRIAGSLHDGVVQDLSGASLTLATAARDTASSDPERARLLDDSAGLVRGAVRSLRTLLVDIYPPSLGTAGLASALDDLAASGSARGVRIDVDAPHPSGLTGAEDRLVFRIAHECVANAVAHSGGTRVSVRVSGRMLEVADDGRGFDPGAVVRDPAVGHFGLRVLADLARDAGAELSARSVAGEGTLWRLTLPPVSRPRAGAARPTAAGARA